MGFTVVQDSPQTIWARVDAADTLYVGQLLYSASDGVLPFGLSKGAADTGSSPQKVPFGVVIGNNDKDKTYNSTYKGNSILGVVAQAGQLARSWFGVEGSNPKGDSAAYVQIALITPSTILSVPLYNASYGTALTVQTITTAQADGMITPETWSAADAASFTADESTIYMRSGANAGIYRIGVNTSQTAPAVTHAMPYDNTSSDTGVQVPVRDIGPAKVQFDAESTFIDVAGVYTTNYAVIDVVRLDLSVSGKEYCEFKFNADHFALIRA